MLLNWAVICLYDAGPKQMIHISQLAEALAQTGFSSLKKWGVYFPDLIDRRRIVRKKYRPIDTDSFLSITDKL